MGRAALAGDESQIEPALLAFGAATGGTEGGYFSEFSERAEYLLGEKTGPVDDHVDGDWLTAQLVVLVVLVVLAAPGVPGCRCPVARISGSITRTVPCVRLGNRQIRRARYLATYRGGA